jgi:ketosteroid isomerase-like protein
MTPAAEPDATEIRSTLVALCDAFNAHDLDRIMAFFADDCVLEMPRGSEPFGARFTGKTAVRAALATRFAGLPDVHYGNARHFVDTAAGTGISQWTLTGTAAGGTRTHVHGCDFYTFRAGLVVRKDSYWKIVE